MKNKSAEAQINDMTSDFERLLNVLDESVKLNPNSLKNLNPAIALLAFKTFMGAFGVLCQTIENGSVLIATAIVNNKDEETGK